MDLITKCPQCQTTFRASLAQLQLRKGYVRCVHCAHIFDGYEAVVPGDEPSTPTPGKLPEPSPAPHHPTPVTLTPVRAEPPPRSPARREFTISDLAGSSSAGSLPNEAPLHTVSGSQSVPPTREPALLGTGSDTAQSLPSEPGLSAVSPDTLPETSDGAGPLRAERAATAIAPPDNGYDPGYRHTAFRWVWQVLVLAGLITFLVQLVIVFRVQIAELMPDTRPVLERLCAEVGCRVAYSRQIDDIHIVRSSLKAARQPDEDIPKDNDADATDDAAAEADRTPGAEAAFTLEVTLRNDYSRPQEWPALTLELTDAAGARIARRHVAATEYLPLSVAGKPFAAMSEQDIVLPLTLKGLNVNGFKVRPYFP